jgi:alpha-1,2-mannosyltransferase
LLRISLKSVLAGSWFLVALVHGYLLAFHRAFVFRDFDIHREVGRRFLSGEYLYADDFCYAYVPMAAMYFSPLALIGRSAGLALRYLLAWACLVATIVLFHRMIRTNGERSWKDLYLVGAGAVLLVFQFVLQDLDDGGPHLILLGMLSLGIYLAWLGKTSAASLLFGLGITIKITPAIFLFLFLWKRQWKLLILTIVATLCWMAVPIVWMGPSSWMLHQSEWTKNAVSSILDQQRAGKEANEQRIRNQALRPTLLRYLVTYPEDHPMRRDDAAYKPLLDLPPGAANALVVLTAVGLLGLFAWSSPREFRPAGDPAWARDCAALLVLALLLSPMTWQQHLAWLVPAAFVLLVSARSSGGLSAVEWVMLGGYVLLAMVLNYEVLGKPRFSAFLSYHPFGVAMMLLLWLVLSRNRLEQRLQPS